MPGAQSGFENPIKWGVGRAAATLKRSGKCEILARSTLARGPRQERSTRQSGAWRSLASALDWGSRGRRFKSCRPDFTCRKSLSCNDLRHDELQVTFLSSAVATFSPSTCELGRSSICVWTCLSSSGRQRYRQSTFTSGRIAAPVQRPNALP